MVKHNLIKRVCCHERPVELIGRKRLEKWSVGTFAKNKKKHLRNYGNPDWGLRETCLGLPTCSVKLRWPDNVSEILNDMPPPVIPVTRLVYQKRWCLFPFKFHLNSYFWFLKLKYTNNFFCRYCIKCRIEDRRYRPKL